jgi:uncharacterized protein YndB with AHSA1/START domain
MQDIEIRAEIPAAPAKVFALLEDHAGYARWAGVKESVLRHPGDPSPHGLGAIRVLRSAGLAIQEEITVYEPPRRLEYALTAGLPVREYTGSVDLAPRGGGTELHWRVRFRPLVPGTGWLLRAALQRTLRGMVDALVRQLA